VPSCRLQTSLALTFPSVRSSRRRTNLSVSSGWLIPTELFNCTVGVRTLTEVFRSNRQRLRSLRGPTNKFKATDMALVAALGTNQGLTHFTFSVTSLEVESSVSKLWLHPSLQASICSKVPAMHSNDNNNNKTRVWKR
jgi:hypothetical protein